MTSEEQILGEIALAPRDVDLRLAYADWLEEHGDPRGAMIRVEEELRSLTIDSDRYWELKPQRHAFLDYCDETYHDEWLVRLGYHRRYEPVFADLPDTPEKRWRLIREFIERWHGIRLADNPTCDALPDVETWISRPAPRSLGQWMSLAHDLGNQFEKVFRDRVAIENLRRHQAVSLMQLAEGDIYWAVRRENMEKADPPVDTYSQYHDGAGQGYEHSGQPHPTLTSFALSHASYFLGRGVSYSIEPHRIEAHCQQHDQAMTKFDNLAIYESENVIVVFDGEHMRLAIWGTTPVGNLPPFFQALMNNE